MFATEELTAEKAQLQLGALEAEREGYERRKIGAAAGVHAGIGLPLTVEQLDDRIGQVDAEIDALKGRAANGKRSKSKKAEA